MLGDGHSIQPGSVLTWIHICIVASGSCGSKSRKRIRRVIGRYNNGTHDFAFLTKLNYAVVGRRAFETDRAHHPLTLSQSVAGSNVDMLAPEALWAVIGIPCADHGSAAVCTGKIFDRALKHITVEVR